MPGKATNEKQSDLQAEKFLHRACLYLKEEFPEQTAGLSEDVLTRDVLEGYAKASAYGFETEQGVMGFIDLLYRVSKTFDTDEETEWARPILESEGLEDSERIEALRQAYVLYSAVSADQE